MSYGFESHTPDGRLSIDGELTFPELHHHATVALPFFGTELVYIPPTTRPLMCTVHVEQGHLREWFYWRQQGQTTAVWFRGQPGARAKVWVYRV